MKFLVEKFMISFLQSEKINQFKHMKQKEKKELKEHAKPPAKPRKDKFQFVKDFYNDLLLKK